MRGWRAATLAFALGLAGCGFHPLYAPASGDAESPTQADLSAITVGQIPDRTGQLLQQALQQRFERGGLGLAHRYDLTVNYAIGEQGIAIQPDTSTTYQRVIGTASWTLTAEDPARTTLVSGKAKAVDGYNFINEQFFLATLEDEIVRGRIAQEIADQITLQLSNYFTRHPSKS